MKEIKQVCIIGGGTAGYLSALTLEKIIPDVDITLIESLEIPVIGVGEATTPKLLRLLHEVLEIDQGEFHRLVRPTWKLGIRFNWGHSLSNDFNYPFGSIHPHLAEAITGDLNDCSLIAQLMGKDKSLIFKNSANADYRMLSPTRSYAYHIDNKSLVEYLKTKIFNSRINHLNRTVEHVQYGPGGILYIQTDRNEKLNFDLYIDCSGFHKALVRKCPEQSFISYKSTLFTDMAVVGKMPNHGQIMPYTSATTLQHGWVWNTPMHEEDHCGYVFCSDYCSPEQARLELISLYPALKISPHTINFKSGRERYFWKDNMVAIGNSYAFIEPLESTGIHMICIEIIELTKKLLKSKVSRTDKEELNQSIGNQWDMLRWFLGIHFKYNTKKSSGFWKDSNRLIDLKGINDYIENYRLRGPVTLGDDDKLYEKMNKDSVFSAFSFDYWMLAQGVETDWKYTFSNPKHEEIFKHKIIANKALVEKAVSMNEALRVIADNPELLNLNGWFHSTFN